MSDTLPSTEPTRRDRALQRLLRKSSFADMSCCRSKRPGAAEYINLAGKVLAGDTEARDASTFEIILEGEPISLLDLCRSATEWLTSDASSPLTLATILAHALNTLPNAGVANHASTGLTLEAAPNASVTQFVSRQGPSWGARGEVVRGAASAITE